jgi:hypothetical protein
MHWDSGPSASMVRVTADPLSGPQQPTRLPPEPTDPPEAPARQTAELLVSAGAAVVVAAGLAVLADTGPGQLVAGVAGVQALLILTWVFGTGMPGRIGALVIAVLAGGAADAAVVRWPHSQLGPLIGVLGLAIVAMFLHQLTRGVVRVRVVESLSAVAVVVVAVVALAALIQLRHETDGQIASTTIAAAGAALAAGLITDSGLPVPRFDAAVPRGLTGVVVSLVVGGIVTFVRLRDTVEFTGGRAAVLGAAVGAVGGLLSVGVSYITHTAQLPGGAAGRLRPLLVGILPLAILAPVAYVLCLAVRA